MKSRNEIVIMDEETPIPVNVKLGKDFLGYLPAKVVPALISLIAIPIITRLFAPAGYGMYVVVMVTVRMLAVIPASLFGNAVLRFYVVYRRRSKLGAFYFTLGIALILCSLLIAAIFFGSIRALKGSISFELYRLMSLGVVLFVLTSVFDLLLTLLNARQKSVSYSCFSVWGTGMGLLSGILLVVVFEQGVKGLIIGNGAALLVALPWLFYVSFGGVGEKPVFSRAILSEMIKFSAPLVIVNLAAWILSQSDRYIIGVFRNDYELGLYSASYAVSERFFIMLWSLFMLACYPMIVRLWETGGKDVTRKMIGRMSRYYLMIVLPAALGFSVLSKPIIAVFTGVQYHPGYRIVPFVVFGTALLGLQWWPQQGLLLRKKTGSIMGAILASGVLNILLNLIFIPRFGYSAAAVTTLIAYAFLLTLMCLVSRPILSWKFPLSSFLKIAFASAVMGVAVYLVAGNLNLPTSIKVVGGIITGIVVYPAALIAIGELSTGEIRKAVSLVALMRSRRSVS